MKSKKLTPKRICDFAEHLRNEEKSGNTVEKYVRDVRAFYSFSGEDITREKVLAYKRQITEHYAAASVNSMLASLNSFFAFLGCRWLCVKPLKIQRQIYRSEEKELTKSEYLRLCSTAEKHGKERLSLILQTICGTGIRVSELQFLTVQAVRDGEMKVSCKGKSRAVFIVDGLRKKLLRYIRNRGIRQGAVFVTKSGAPIGRSNIWREMKNLCAEAEVNPKKVFPHNLRHLFARVFYALDRDIAKLADVLGHSSINTTRIYIISTGTEHRREMSKMKLIT